MAPLHIRQSGAGGSGRGGEIKVHNFRYTKANSLITNAQSRFAIVDLDAVLVTSLHRTTSQFEAKPLNGIVSAQKAFKCLRSSQGSCLKGMEERIVFPRRWIIGLTSRQIEEFVSIGHPPNI